MRTISSSVTLNGLHGASAIRTIAPCDAIVVARDRLLARGEDLVVVGHHVVGRQPAVLLAQRHRAAGRMEAHARGRAAAAISADSRSPAPRGCR